MESCFNRILLFQGLTYESSDGNNSGVVFTFGILIVFMLVAALFLTFGSVFFTLSRRNNVLIPREALSILPRDMYLELLLINSLSQIENNGEILIVPSMKQLKKTEVDELMSLNHNGPRSSPTENPLKQDSGVQGSYEEIRSQFLEHHMSHTTTGEMAIVEQ
jgi:hypothetical protein